MGDAEMVNGVGSNWRIERLKWCWLSKGSLWWHPVVPSVTGYRGTLLWVVLYVQGGFMLRVKSRSARRSVSGNLSHWETWVQLARLVDQNGLVRWGKTAGGTVYDCKWESLRWLVDTSFIHFNCLVAENDLLGSSLLDYIYIYIYYIANMVLYDSDLSHLWNR
jgi:hypothetical protein